jgi:hypothetical protein
LRAARVGSSPIHNIRHGSCDGQLLEGGVEDVTGAGAKAQRFKDRQRYGKRGRKPSLFLSAFRGSAVAAALLRRAAARLN